MQQPYCTYIVFNKSCTWDIIGNSNLIIIQLHAKKFMKYFLANNFQNGDGFSNGTIPFMSNLLFHGH